MLLGFFQQNNVSARDSLLGVPGLSQAEIVQNIQRCGWSTPAVKQVMELGFRGQEESSTWSDVDKFEPRERTKQLEISSQMGSKTVERYGSRIDVSERQCRRSPR